MSFSGRVIKDQAVVKKHWPLPSVHEVAIAMVSSLPTTNLILDPNDGSIVVPVHEVEGDAGNEKDDSTTLNDVEDTSNANLVVISLTTNPLIYFETNVPVLFL